MSGQQMKRVSRIALAPSVLLLVVGMIVPLATTLWLSFRLYNLMNPALDGFAG